MKKIQYNKKAMILTLALVSVSMPGYGQDKPNTPAAYEQMKQKSQWLNSSNAAGLLLDNPVNFTEISVSGDSYRGGFHRPQEGERGSNLNFNAEGAIYAGKVYAWGKFDYTRKTVKDANFNASIIDPFRGMPYMVADTNRSEWKNQVYDMALKVSTPLLPDRLHMGLEAQYKAVSGAKQRDPRTENYYYIIQLKPGFVYSLNARHHIGANFDYFNLKEESVMSKVNTYVDQEYYNMYGLGTSVQRIGTGRTTDYTGNSVGGGFQYHYHGAINLLFSSGYTYKVEDVRISFSNAEDDSGVKDRIWKSGLQAFTRPDENLTHFLTLEYSDRKIDGIECITQYDNTAEQGGYLTLLKDVRSKYKTQAATLDYDVTVNKSEEYGWKMGLGVKYTNSDDLYISPRSEKNAENIAFQVRAKRNFVLSPDKLKRRMLLGADWSLSRNLSGGYNYNGSHPEYLTVSKFQQTDSDCLNAGYWSAGASVAYSRKIRADMAANFFAKAGFSYTKADKSFFDNRQSVRFSVGCNF
jgi:hypothetical protein